MSKSVTVKKSKSMSKSANEISIDKAVNTIVRLKLKQAAPIWQGQPAMWWVREACLLEIALYFQVHSL